MMKKFIVSILTLSFIGLIFYFSDNYDYKPWCLFILICFYFTFAYITIIKRYPYLFIFYTISGFFLLTTVIGLFTGNVILAYLPANFLTFALVLAVPYLSALAFYRYKKYKYYILPVFMLANYITSYYYVFLNDNKSHFATYNGSYNYHLKDELIFSNSAGEAKKLQSGKIYVVDMWNKGCGVCLIKFPKVNSLRKKYESDSDIEFIALNIYQSEDEIISSQKRFNRENLDFPTYYLAQENAAELKPEFFPITLVIKDNKIIFRGSVETLNALDFLYLK